MIVARVLPRLRYGRINTVSSRVSYGISQHGFKALSRSFSMPQGDNSMGMRHEASSPPTASQIKKQVEYYFSPRNISRDIFLQNKAAEHPQGWVPLDVIMTFNRMKLLGANPQETIEALKDSEVEIMEEDGKVMLRRKDMNFNEFIDKGVQVGSNIPCKYYASSGVCLSHLNGEECIEYVGNRLNREYVTKVHDNEFAQKVADEWLNMRMPDFRPVQQDYRFVAVMDLEGGSRGELIEMPCIVLDVKEGREVGRFHRWVTPTHFLNRFQHLSPQVAATNAVSFSEALVEFNNFLTGHGVTFGRNKGIVAFCGDHDASLMKRNCTKHELILPYFLRSWLNVKDLSLNYFMLQDPTANVQMLAQKVDGLNRLANFLQIGSTAESMHWHHLGMYDTQKCAQIVIKLAETTLLNQTARVQKNGRRVHVVDHWVRKHLSRTPFAETKRKRPARQRSEEENGDMNAQS